MKRHAPLNPSSFDFIQGETTQTYDLTGKDMLHVTMFADKVTTLYLATVTGEMLPLTADTLHRAEYRLDGWSELIVKAPKASNIGLRVLATNPGDVDPLSYKKVNIGPPPATTERDLMQSAIRAELARRGIQLEDDGDFDVTDENDLEFEDDYAESITPYSEMPGMREEETIAQPESESPEPDSPETMDEPDETSPAPEN